MYWNTFSVLTKINKTYKQILICACLFASCSTQKNTAIRRAYHNITARYNIYFNGYESFNKGILKIDETYRDDFTTIIPVFNYNSPDLVGTVTPDMDRAINKATKVITFHSITAKPKIKKKYLTEKDEAFLQKSEYNKWIDDSYLLIGKSHFYKHDFSLSVETFNFLIKRFNEEPSKHEALIWLARSYNNKNDFRESERILTLLENDNELPKKVFSSFFSTYADFYVRQDEYEKAIPKLEEALEYARKKKDKLRYSFLLAQLYQKTGDLTSAAEMYRKVIKKNPPYEMTFNAKMNLASVYESTTGKGKSIKDQLLKMLKDEKNTEFKDQIYYALGEIEMTDGNTDKALGYFKLSAQSSVSNNNQKSKSYLTIADIYYKMPDYRLSEAYYDSAVAMLNTDYPGYDLIYNKSQNLSKLVENLTIIEVEDSLQVLAKLSKSERIARIDAAIARIIKEENEAKQREREQMMNAQMDRMEYSRNSNTINSAEGGWYFYNPTAINFGQKEFTLKWGNRKLEDNWRRSVKRTINIEEVDEKKDQTVSDTAQKVNLITDPKKREYYLQYIPVNDSLLEISNNKIIDAYYTAGIIYKNDLEDYDLAIETFKELNDRFPVNKYDIAAYYELYKINTELNNATTSDYYKNLIIKKYPESLYAKVLINPDYFIELEAEQKRVSTLYEDTYNKYKNGYYADVLGNMQKAINLYPDHKLIPKFRLLGALAMGKTLGSLTLNEELKKIIEDYPKSEIKPDVESMIAYLSQADEMVKELEEQIELEEKQAQAEELYKFDETAKHFYAVVVDNNADINQLKFNIINFNLDYFNNNNFETSSTDLGDYTIVKIEIMENQKEAFNYHAEIIDNSDIFIDVNESEKYMFVISNVNYNVLITHKSVETFLLFYNKYILEQ